MLTTDQLHDLHLLYCNKGKKEKVVLGLTDTMYKKRIQTAGKVDKLSQEGFKELVEAMPGVMEYNNDVSRPMTGPSSRINLDFIFMNNVGPSKDKKFELTFDHFLDALANLARLRYPYAENPSVALATLINVNVQPLYTAIFGVDEAENNDPSNNNNNNYQQQQHHSSARSVTGGSVTGGGGGGGEFSASAGIRASRLVLTPQGTMPLSAASALHGPALQMMVSERSLPSDRTARYDIKLAGGSSSGASVASGMSRVPSSASLLLENGSSSSSSNGGQRIGSHGTMGSSAQHHQLQQQQHQAGSITSPSSSSIISSNQQQQQQQHLLQDRQNSFSSPTFAIGNSASSTGGSNANNHHNSSSTSSSSSTSTTNPVVTIETVNILRDQIGSLLIAVDNLTSENASLREENDALRRRLLATTTATIAGMSR